MELPNGEREEPLVTPPLQRGTKPTEQRAEPQTWEAREAAGPDKLTKPLEFSMTTVNFTL